ncbi:MAG: type II toxin-antitoxin system RelE/ParE family toxin [Synergistaceae bacterium]|nr:type II toxin-antitoxin system RelE/ParE family toxin [Synergistaceae bacterium]
MSNIRYTPEAEDDLAGIKDCITREIGNPTASLNTVGKITKRIRGLKQFPELGARLSSIIDVDTDYRFLVCMSYIVFCRIDGNDVYIIRVLYGRRDYAKILFGELPPDEADDKTE